MMIIPPFAATYATQNPYISVQEFLNAGTGVDVSQLVPAGGTLTNTQTLANMIRRASGWADSLCNQKLSATINTRAGTWQVRSDNTVRIPLQFSPVVAITNITTGWSPSALTPLTETVDVWPDDNNIVTIPLPGSNGGMSYAYRQFFPDDIYVSVTYVNGWADTQLTGPVVAGALSLPVWSGLGINPGQTMTLYSGTTGETVTVAPTYVPTAATTPTSIPLVTGLVSGYQLGDTLTAMPQEIKQAVIFLTAVLIKTRGAEAMVMSSIHGNPQITDKMEPGAGDDWEAAVDLLSQFKRAS